MIVMILFKSEDMPPAALHRRCVIGIGFVAFVLLGPLIVFVVTTIVGSPRLIKRGEESVKPSNVPRREHRFAQPQGSRNMCNIA